MRPSPRIVNILAGLAIAVGGLVIASPAAHAAPADIADCATHLSDQGVEVTDTARTACYVGLVGEQPGCVSALGQLGVADSIAAEACRRAAR
jgi:hypothetical protein